jgi:1,4-alpha-glucan branching enzyme
VATLNQLLQQEAALHQNQFNQKGFEWVDLNHRQESVISFKRKGKKSR